MPPPDPRDGVLERYASCVNADYEGAIGDYCLHLELVHHCPAALLDDLRGGLTEGTWLRVDGLHR